MKKKIAIKTSKMAYPVPYLNDIPKNIKGKQ